MWGVNIQVTRVCWQPAGLLPFPWGRFMTTLHLFFLLSCTLGFANSMGQVMHIVGSKNHFLWWLFDSECDFFLSFLEIRQGSLKPPNDTLLKHGLVASHLAPCPTRSSPVKELPHGLHLYKYLSWRARPSSKEIVGAFHLCSYPWHSWPVVFNIFTLEDLWK